MFDFKFDWCKEVECGVDIVDAQHQELFRIGRDIEQLIVNGRHDTDKRQLLAIVCDLREFVNYHIYTEESLMETYSYPNVTKHKAAHKAFHDFILCIDIPALDKHPEKVLPVLKETLQDVLFGHILTEDRDLCNFINQCKK